MQNYHLRDIVGPEGSMPSTTAYRFVSSNRDAQAIAHAMKLADN